MAETRLFCEQRTRNSWEGGTGNDHLRTEGFFSKRVSPPSSTRGTWIVIWNAVFLLVLMGPVAGCLPFGGRPVNVNFTSDPAGAEVFLVPLITWETRGRTELLKDTKALEQYRVGGTRVTPFNARVGYHEQVLIVRFKERFAWTEVTPDDGANLFLPIPSGAR